MGREVSTESNIVIPIDLPVAGNEVLLDCNIFNKKFSHVRASFQRILESERYVSPVERSHQIMEQVHVEWQKEQERAERLAKEKLEKEKLEKEQEKLKEAENMDLSAPNKLPKTTEQEGGKNLTAKQKAALVRQQKLAKAKSVTNKAHKKTSEGKSSKSSKNSSKNGNGGAGKEKTKNKPKTKQVKVKSATNVDSSDKQGLISDTIVDVVGISVTEASFVASAVVGVTTADETGKGLILTYLDPL